MEQIVYLLYECDAWLSSDSKVLMGVFTEDGLSEGIREYVSENMGNFRDEEADAEYGPEDEEEIEERIINEFFNYNMQTQGYQKNLVAIEATINRLKEL